MDTSGENFERIEYTMNIYNKMLLKLGYDWLIDNSTTSRGITFSNQTHREKLQT